jgi:hypothetical protein
MKHKIRHHVFFKLNDYADKITYYQASNLNKKFIYKIDFNEFEKNKCKS